MRVIIHEIDVVVVGGGLAGTCAAIAAARQGAATALIEQRAVLGGNASSLVRVHIGGAPDHGVHFDARETGIIEEIRLAYAVKDPENSYAWIDQVLAEACSAEPSLTTYHGIAIDDVKAIGDDVDGYARRIVECSGVQHGSETRHVFKAKMFVDGTGDGTIGALAGAEFRMGRESKAEFSESLAPDVADSFTLGSSILFEARDMGHPVSFTPPPWAKKLPKDYSDTRRGRQPTGGNAANGFWHGLMRVGWWWNEYGGTMDTITDDEAIKQELLAILYGLWDHVKNSGDPRYAKATNYDITWVGSVTGKRESRRIVGDYILRQGDLTSGLIFQDQVAAGGWNIDLHPPRGFYDDLPACQQKFLDGLYSIPYRSIYSRNVANLFLASRCLSVSHVAHGSTRLQATLASVGQAAGIASATCAREGITPRVLGKTRFRTYQQELLKQDGFLLELRNDDSNDVARDVPVSASSAHPLHFEHVDNWIPLLFPVAQQFPAMPEGDVGHIHSISILVKNDSDVEVCIEGGIRECNHVGDLGKAGDLAKLRGTCPPRSTSWIPMVLDQPVKVDKQADVARPHLFWFYIGSPDGPAHLVSIGKDGGHYPGFRGGFFDEDADEWRIARVRDKSEFFISVVKARGVYCFSIPGFTAFPPENVTNGYSRPGRLGPNLWVSDPSCQFPQWLLLDLGTPRQVSKVHVTFDNGLDKPYPHKYNNDYKPWPVYGRPPRCARDFDVIAVTGGQERLIGRIRDNFQRKVVVRTPVASANRIKIAFLSSNGAKEVGVYEVRVY